MRLTRNRSLLSDGYIESLDRNESRATFKSSASGGRGLESIGTLAPAVTGRIRGKGIDLYGAPPLINQQDWYLNEQLAKFSSGQRHHYNDYDPEETSQSDLDKIVAWITNLP